MASLDLDIILHLLFLHLTHAQLVFIKTYRSYSYVVLLNTVPSILELFHLFFLSQHKTALVPDVIILLPSTKIFLFSLYFCCLKTWYQMF